MGIVEDLLEHSVDALTEHPFLIAGAVAVGGLLAMAGEEAYSDSSDSSPSVYGVQLNRQQKTISQLERELAEKEEEKKAKEKSAGAWIEETERIWKELEGYRHELFLPGSLEEVKNSLDTARALLEKGIPEAAAPAARNACQLAKLTREKLVRCELAWERQYQRLLEKRRRVEQFTAHCAAWEVRVQTEEGEEAAAIDVDYWSDGRLTELTRQLEIKEVERECSTEELQELVERTEKLLNRMEELPQEAAAAFLDSQQRLWLCENVYHALLRRGWMPVREDFYGCEDGDDRKAVYLRMQNAQGTNVNFRFTARGGFQVSAVFRDVGNRDLQQHLADTLLGILREDGFAVTEFQSLTELTGRKK